MKDKPLQPIHIAIDVAARALIVLIEWAIFSFLMWVEETSTSLAYALFIPLMAFVIVGWLSFFFYPFYRDAQSYLDSRYGKG